MKEVVNQTGLALIFVGAILSLGRAFWSRLIVGVYQRFKGGLDKQRLETTVAVYLMLTGMMFTIAGLLGLFNIISY